MNFKAIALTLLSCSVSIGSTNAGELDDVIAKHQPIVGKEKINIARSKKVRSDSLYYVQLEQSPLATYQGDVKGYTATNILASGQSNSIAGGVLNTKSSASKNYLDYLAAKQAQFLNRAQSVLNRKIDVSHQYKIVLNAFAMQISATEAKILALEPGVKSVQKVGMHYLHSDSGPNFIKAKQVWNGVGSFVGTKGEGVIVGVIDTGINAAHPSFADVGGDGFDHQNPRGEGNYLGDCKEYPKFCNDKLIGIVSFAKIVDNLPEVVNGDYQDLEDKLKVGYDYNAHGSHVASTAAGNVLTNVPFYLNVSDEQGSIVKASSFQFDSISGVAPHANIVSYQVCGLDGCYAELTVKAVEHAIENGVNVLNYSAGGASSTPWNDIDALAFLNARAAGVHVATSAGNSGPDAKTIGSPGNAPWITTVAAYSHDRAFSSQQLTDFIGGETAITADIIGKGVTVAYTGNVVLAADYGDASCNSEFAEGTFDGEIVVCHRGEIARVRKGVNVVAGGAGGLILANVAGGSESLNADTHVLPAIHISAADGEVLIAWLATGSEHKATIKGSELVSDPELGDIAGSFSSRGPNDPFATMLSPDIAGPGVDVYAANSEDHYFDENVTESPYTTMSGTSMSSPHLAGALALIHASHPDWTPAQVQSAIMTTANNITYKDDYYTGVKQRSNLFDQGAGSVRVDQAIKAGLLLDISKQQYIDADPYFGGDPTTLNMSSMAANHCISTCSWVRTVTATADSTWTASFEYLNPGFKIEVSPNAFTLAKGQSQELTFTASTTSGLEDEWVHGFTTLVSENSDIHDSTFQTVVNFSAGTAPDEISAEVNNANNVIIINDVITEGTNELQVNGFGLSKVKSYQGSAAGAGSNKDPWMNLDSVYAVQIVVPAYTKRIIADIVSSSAPDMDLYVGFDEDGDGLPNFSEVYYSTVCLSGNADSIEHCDVVNPLPGTYWIFAHNFEGTTIGELDSVTMEVTKIGYTTNPSFNIDAPLSTSKDEALNISLTVNGSLSPISEPIMPGNKYYGLVELGSKPKLKRNIGQTLVVINGIDNVIEEPLVALINGESSMSYTVDEGSEDITFSVQDSSPALANDQLTYNWVQTNGDSAQYGIMENGDLVVSVPADVSATEEIMFELTVSNGRSVSVASAKIIVNDVSAPEPTPLPEPKDKSSGGTTSIMLLVFMLIAISKKRHL